MQRTREGETEDPRALHLRDIHRIEPSGCGLRVLSTAEKHDAGDGPALLAGRRVASKRVGVHVQAVVTRPVVTNRERDAPLREPGAERPIFVEPVPEPVEAFGNPLAGCGAVRVVVRVA